MGSTRTSRIRFVLFRHADEHDNQDQSASDHNDDAGDGALGDKGKAALDAERKARRDAEKAAKAAADELAKVRAEAEDLRSKAQTDDERKIAEAVAAREAEVRRELDTERAAERAEAQRQLLQARVLTAAAGKLTNPADAAAFVNLDDLDRDDQGNVADSVLSAAVEALLAERPYLAAKAGTNGSADQGQRRDAPPDFKDPKQLEQELAKFNTRLRR